MPLVVNLNLLLLNYPALAPPEGGDSNIFNERVQCAPIALAASCCTFTLCFCSKERFHK